MTWDHVSASQIETFELCTRKWYFKSIMQLPTPDSAAAKLGKDVHASIERYLKGEIAAEALHPLAWPAFQRGLIPKPGTVRVEHAIKGDAIKVAGVPVTGFIDVLDLQPWRLAQNRAAVTDWKTRGNLSYAKQAEQLDTDIQFNIYGAEAFRVAPGNVDTVDVQHVNIETKPPRRIQVAGPVSLTRAGIAAFFAERLAPTVTRMVLASKLRTPAALPPNPRACAAFGGCPFLDKCNSLAATAAISTTSTTQNGESTVPTPNGPDKSEVQARLAAMRGGGTATPNANPVRPPDAPASGAKAALQARLNANKAADVTKPDSPPANVASAAAPGAESERKPRGHQEKLAALNYDAGQVARMQASEMRRVIEGKIDAKGVSVSPDGLVTVVPVRPKVEAASAKAYPVPGVPEPDLQDVDSCVKYVIDALGWTDEEIDNMPADDMIVLIAKDKIARDTVDLKLEDGKIVDFDLKPPPAPTRPVADVVEDEVQPAVEGLVLYIGCRPVKGEHRKRCGSLADHVALLGRRVAEDAKVEHYALMEYNDGAKRIAALLLRDPPKGIFYVDPRAATSAYTLEVLIPLADTVVTAGG